MKNFADFVKTLKSRFRWLRSPIVGPALDTPTDPFLRAAMEKFNKAKADFFTAEIKVSKTEKAIGKAKNLLASGDKTDSDAMRQARENIHTAKLAGRLAVNELSTARDALDEARKAVIEHTPKAKQPGPAPQKPAETFAFLPITEEFIAEVLRMAKVKDAVTAAETKSLVDLQNHYDQQHDAILENTHNAATERYKNQARTLAKTFEAMSGADIEKHEVLTKDAFLAEARTKIKALKQSLRNVTAEAIPIARKITERIEAAAREVVAQMELQEKKQATTFGHEFVPSISLVACKQLTWRLSNDLPVEGMAVPPKRLLPYLPIKWEMPVKTK